MVEVRFVVAAVNGNEAMQTVTRGDDIDTRPHRPTNTSQYNYTRCARNAYIPSEI